MHLLASVLPAIILSSLLVGCSIEKENALFEPDIVDTSDHPNGVWIGTHVSKLLKKFGEPDRIINSTFMSGPPTMAYVYDAKSGANCVDAFVIRGTDQVIIKYFCR